MNICGDKRISLTSTLCSFLLPSISPPTGKPEPSFVCSLKAARRGGDCSGCWRGDCGSQPSNPEPLQVMVALLQRPMKPAARRVSRERSHKLNRTRTVARCSLRTCSYLAYLLAPWRGVMEGQPVTKRRPRLQCRAGTGTGTGDMPMSGRTHKTQHATSCLIHKTKGEDPWL